MMNSQVKNSTTGRRLSPVILSPLITECTSILTSSAKETTDDSSMKWDDRVNSMKAIIDHIENQVLSIEDVNAVVEMVTPLVPGLALQLRDIRSAVVKMACRLISSLAFTIGEEFKSVADELLESILALTIVTIGVMNQSGRTCLADVVKYSRVSIKKLTDASTVSKHGLIRVSAMESIRFAVTEWRKVEIKETLESVLYPALTSALSSDSNATVRSLARATLVALSTKFPNDISKDLLKCVPSKNLKLQSQLFTQEFPNAAFTKSVIESAKTNSSNSSNGIASSRRMSIRELRRKNSGIKKSSLPVTEIVLVTKKPEQRLPEPVNNNTVQQSEPEISEQNSTPEIIEQKFEPEQQQQPQEENDQAEHHHERSSKKTHATTTTTTTSDNNTLSNVQSVFQMEISESQCTLPNLACPTIESKSAIAHDFSLLAKKSDDNSAKTLNNNDLEEELPELVLLPEEEIMAMVLPQEEESEQMAEEDDSTDEAVITLTTTSENTSCLSRLRALASSKLSKLGLIFASMLAAVVGFQISTKNKKIKSEKDEQSIYGSFYTDAWINTATWYHHVRRSHRLEMPSSLQQIKEYHKQISSDIQAAEDRITADRDAKQASVRSILRIIQFDTIEGQTVAHLDATTKICEKVEAFQKRLDKIESDYQNERRELSYITDKKTRSALLLEAKERRNVTVTSLQPEFNALVEQKQQILGMRHSSTTSNNTTRPTEEKTLSDEEQQDLCARIKTLLKQRKTQADPQRAYIEVAYLYLKLDKFKLAEKYFLKAAENSSKLYKKYEKSRMREATSQLYKLYLRKKNPVAASHMIRKWLDLQEDRRKSLEVIEKELKEYEDLRDSHLKTEDAILNHVILKKELGSLSDLRLELLEEMLEETPSDLYLLETIGNLYVRLKEYDKAYVIFQKYIVQLQQNKEQPPLLWADIFNSRQVFSE